MGLTRKRQFLYSQVCQLRLSSYNFNSEGGKNIINTVSLGIIKSFIFYTVYQYSFFIVVSFTNNNLQQRNPLKSPTAHLVPK